MSLGNGKVNIAATSEMIESSPYIGNRKSQSPSPDETVKQEKFDDEAGPATDPDMDRLAKRRKQQKVFFAIAAILITLFILYVVEYADHKTKIDYEIRERQQAKGQNGAASSDNSDLTLQAIKQAHDVIASGPSSASDAMSSNASKPVPAQSPAPPRLSPPFGQTINQPEPSTYFPGLSSSRPEAKSTSTSAPGVTTKTDPTNSSLPATKRRENSTYVIESGESKDKSVSGGDARAMQVALRKNSPPVVLPSFGSVLPVRTLGAIYTLRTGSMVRMELTRDMNGDGWILKRGTIFVGTTRGNESDRGYINAIGFIDPASGRYVKLTGEVVGTDGAEGLKGKRHQLSSGWKRTLGKLASSAINLGGSLATGRGNTVVVADGASQGAINPITDELNGVIGGSVNQQQSGFVEVLADTPGYILITDLPAEIRGQDAAPSFKSDEILAESNPELVRVSTGLSMKELADLLTSGSPDEIKAALPRMTPDMKRLALAVLGEDK